MWGDRQKPNIYYNIRWLRSLDAYFRKALLAVVRTQAQESNFLGQKPTGALPPCATVGTWFNCLGPQSLPLLCEPGYIT